MQGAPMVRLVYLARLREAVGRASEDWPLAGAADVGALLEALRRRGAPFDEVLAAGRALRVAVNHDMARLDTPLRHGDEVAIFPPVTGG